MSQRSAPTPTASSLDDLRVRFPGLGFAVYAYDPGGDVTLEIHSADGGLYAFVGPTLAAAIATTFPPLEPPPAPDVFG